MTSKRQPRRWISRQEQERARHEMIERRAQWWEEDHGRPPTPDELRAIAEQAEESIALWSAIRRALATAEADAGRPLTDREVAEIKKSIQRRVLGE